ncbi:MAG: hypothetical protein ACKOBW_10295 [Planctomycetota bacterium]
MNKAFVREADSWEEYCPRCGGTGQPVSRAVMLNQLRDPASLLLADNANICLTPTCDVVYFDQFERTILTSALKRSIYPKDPSAPICSCFGLTADDVELDLTEGAPTRTRACVKRAQSSEARCEETAPSGRSCLADVQGLYLRTKAARR